MLRNYLAAALRNMANNKFYAGLTVAGLTIGLAAVLLIALFVDNELRFDGFLPHADRTYLVTAGVAQPGKAREDYALTPPEFAGWMKIEFPQIEAVSRFNMGWTGLRHNMAEGSEQVAWADPDIFSLLALPMLHGDAGTALASPDSLVLTEHLARKYFGTGNPIGQVIQINRNQTMTVSGVLKDFPQETTLATEVFASGRAPFSGLAGLDKTPLCSECYMMHHQWGGTYTYLRLKPGADPAAIEQAFPAKFQVHKNGVAPDAQGVRFFFDLLPLTAVHTHANLLSTLKPGVDPSILYGLSAAAFVIVLVVGINFVSLMTARSTRRAVEVGVRKVSGAKRGDLMVQFFAESLLYVVVGALLALGLAALLLPVLNAFVDRSIVLDPFGNWHLLVLLILLVAGLGLLAGAYPATVLSSFRPAGVLKGGTIRGSGSQWVREGLVVFQFAILIVLFVATFVIWGQTSFALNDGLRLDKDAVYNVWNCSDAFKDQVVALPGVRSAGCSNRYAMSYDDVKANGLAVTPANRKVIVSQSAVDFDFFRTYGLKPLAGRFFDRAHGGDVAPNDPPPDPAASPSVVPSHGSAPPFHAPLVVNETAARAFGFRDPAQAVGKSVTIDMGPNTEPSEIVGVVQDFSLDAVRSSVPPTVFFVKKDMLDLMSVKLSGRDVPATLAAINRAWTAAGVSTPFDIYPLDKYLQEKFADVIRLSTLLIVLAGLALVAAALGLFALAAFTAEQRTKEIGIRKAMGAKVPDIVLLLVKRFSKPVLWANLIAWPVAFLVMDDWLSGFANHVPLRLWMFGGAGAVAFLIAWVTVGSHALAVARARPAGALRYE